MKPLLIGNQVYTPKVGRLKNPHEDVALVGAALKQLGFQVTILKEADYGRWTLPSNASLRRCGRKGRA
jgi:hypothetical protein